MTCATCHFFPGGPTDKDVVCREPSIPRLVTDAMEPACASYREWGSAEPATAPPPKPAPAPGPDMDKARLDSMLARLRAEHSTANWRDWREAAE